MAEKEEEERREASKKWLDSQLDRNGKEELPGGIKDLLGQVRYGHDFTGGPRPGGQQQPVASVNAAALKLPPFWANDATLWFAQIEAQFGIRNITQDETKYWYVVAALDHTTMAQVKDVLNNPPRGDKYAALKERLTKTYTLTEYERAGAILHGSELGDQSPAKLMNEMLGHMGTQAPGLLFRRAFLDRMPEDIKQAVIQAKLEDCEEMAQMADRMWKSRREVPVAMSLAKKPQATNRSGLCRNHARFGKGAYNCADPVNCEMRTVISKKPPAAGN